MAIVPMSRLLKHAQENSYAVGYFEAWNMESLFAVIDAAESTGSPVIIGFNGGFIGHEDRIAKENVYYYGGLGRAVAVHSKVPVSFIFNEAAKVPLLIKALHAGFNVIMHDQESCSFEESIVINKYLVKTAHYQDAEVEAEIGQLPAADISTNTMTDGEKTDPEKAVDFIRQTGVDALAVSVGNIHMHEGEEKSRLDLALVEKLRKRISVPLVLHGGTGVDEKDLKEAIRLGISKINVGTVLRRAFIDTLKEYYQVNDVDKLDVNDVTSRGGELDMCVQARKSIMSEVVRMIYLFGSEKKGASIF
jgi:ketose-bisphosphate aldolase